MSTPSRRVRLLVAMTFVLVLGGPGPAMAQAEDKALGRPAAASSVERARPGGQCNETKCAASKATDGDPGTRWEGEYTDTEWWQVDLGRPRQVDQVALVWHLARAQTYAISTSLDGTSFSVAAEVTLDLSPAELDALERTRRHRRATTFAPRAARYVRVTSRKRAPIVVGGRVRLFGVSFWEANVFGPPDDAPAAPAGQPAGSPPPGAPATGSAPGPTRPAGAGFDLPAASTPPPAPPPPAAQAPAPPRTLLPFPIVRIKGALTASGARIELLSVRAPRTATVRVRCRGRDCPRRVRSRKGTGRIRELQRRLRAGTVIDVAVTQPGRYGKHTRFVIRRGRAPRRVDRCTRGTSTRPITCPAD